MTRAWLTLALAAGCASAPHDPVNDPALVAIVELALSRDDGSIARMATVRSSGVATRARRVTRVPSC